MESMKNNIMPTRTYIEISYNKLKHNLEIIKKYAGSRSIICVVKDNAYGLGAVNISKFIESDEKVVAFAVSNVKEAEELKNNGIKKDIIIIGHISENEYSVAIKNNFVFTISSIEQATAINNTAKELNLSARLEIAIDTGMGRIGFEATDGKTIDSIKKINVFSNIKIYGMFSHFSVADTFDFDEESVKYTREQENKFNHVNDELKRIGVKIENTSISSSAGTMKGIGDKCTSIRPGIMLYGIWPSLAFGNVDIKPIMSLKSKIVFIKNIKENTSVSYGRRFTSDKEMKVATVACGYGDGYPRTASNVSSVIINDKKCRILGRITMDMFMVDVTDVNSKVGDEVILIGESEHEKITLDDLCSETHEFSYEILTRINHRVDRVYID